MSEMAHTNVALDRWAVTTDNDQLRIVIRPNNKPDYTITSRYTPGDLDALISFLVRVKERLTK